jgi:hypothetical protein
VTTKADRELRDAAYQLMARAVLGEEDRPPGDLIVTAMDVVLSDDRKKRSLTERKIQWWVRAVAMFVVMTDADFARIVSGLPPAPLGSLLGPSEPT